MSAVPQVVVRGLATRERADLVLVSLAVAHGAALLAAPSLPLIALGMWWNANTIAHNFIHAPFFRRRELNAAFSCSLSLVLGFPLSLWRRRHLEHHAGGGRLPPPRLAAVETGLLLLLWASLAWVAPRFCVAVYLPGYAVGLGLCSLQGYFEHDRGTTSHYGVLYNRLFFNDGYHVEHHQRPSEHWTRLPGRRATDAPASRWPPVLRWLERIDLELLERLVLRVGVLQRWVLAAHQRAFRRLLPQLPEPRRVVIVGGGLFPRTAIVLRRLLPKARLTVVDAKEPSLELARPLLPEGVDVERRRFDASRPEDADLVVIPLAYDGDRTALYRTPPAPTLIVHDWIWARRRAGVRVSFWLLKRLNLVRR
jgi:hypothetical protein